MTAGHPPQPRRPRPRARRAVVTAVVTVLALAVVLVAADRAARHHVLGRVAAQVQEEAGLPQRPQVSVAGGSFLRQALRGRFDDVEVTAERVPTDGVELERVRVRVPAVHVPRGVLTGGAGTLRVEPGTFEASAGFDSLLERVDTGSLAVDLSREGDDLRAATGVQVLGLRVPLALLVEPRLVDGAVRLVPVSAEVAGRDVSLVRARQLLRATGVDVLDGWVVPLTGVPPEAEPRALRVTGTGVLVVGTTAATSFDVR